MKKTNEYRNPVCVADYTKGFDSVQTSIVLEAIRSNSHRRGLLQNTGRYIHED